MRHFGQLTLGDVAWIESRVDEAVTRALENAADELDVTGLSLLDVYNLYDAISDASVSAIWTEYGKAQQWILRARSKKRPVVTTVADHVDKVLELYDKGEPVQYDKRKPLQR